MRFRFWLVSRHRLSAEATLTTSSYQPNSLPEWGYNYCKIVLMSTQQKWHWRSRFYPVLNINASGAFTNSGGLGIVNPGKWLLTAVGSLTQPIFQNGKLVAGLKVAKAQYEQAFNTWQNAVLTAGSEVSNALVQYNSAEEKSKIQAKQIEVLKKNVEDTKELMASAGSTYLEVITAQSSLLNTELSKVADDFSKMQAVVNLYSALGGGSK